MIWMYSEYMIFWLSQLDTIVLFFLTCLLICSPIRQTGFPMIVRGAWYNIVLLIGFAFFSDVNRVVLFLMATILFSQQ